MIYAGSCSPDVLNSSPQLNEGHELGCFDDKLMTLIKNTSLIGVINRKVVVAIDFSAI